MSWLDATSRNHDEFSLLATNLKIYEPVHFNELATRGASICYQAGKLPEWANAMLVNSLSKRQENFRFESLRYDYLWIYNIAYNLHSANFTRANYTMQTGIRKNLTPIIRKVTSVLNGANCRLDIGITRYEQWFCSLWSGVIQSFELNLSWCFDNDSPEISKIQLQSLFLLNKSVQLTLESVRS